MRQPILVTGSHRSGSTWVGRVIASSPEVFYIHEPLNAGFAPHYLGLSDLPWYPYICAANEDRFKAPFDRLLSGRFPKISPGFFRPDRLLRFRILHFLTFRLAAARKRRFLLKDPFALVSVDWFEQRLGVQSVIIMRHPAAFVASLKNRGWFFDFSDWVRQKELLDGPFRDFREEVARAAENPPDIIDQGCLLWNCLARHVIGLMEARPERIVVRHEDFCADPLGAFRSLFDRLQLDWHPRTQRFVRKTSFQEGAESSSDAFWFRNSQTVAKSWKNRLSQDEVDNIREATADHASRFYSPEDWD